VPGLRRELVTTPVPGPPPSVLSAILRASLAHPQTADDPSEQRDATFGTENMPRLPSLTTDVVFMPQYAFLDATVEISGDLTVDGSFAPSGGGVTDWINVATQYGADPTGATDSTVAIDSAVSAASVSGAPVYFPAGTYKVTSTLDWRIAGLAVTGAGSGTTKIVQHTANTQLIRLAGQGQRISGFTLAYSSQAASGDTSSIAMSFGDDTAGSCFESTFSGLCIQLANTAMAIDPSVAVKAGLFSCTFSDIEVNGYSVSAISFNGGNGLGAHCTGCVFSNIYIHNNFTGSDANSTSWPVLFRNWDEVVCNQLNVEHAEVFSADALLFANVGNAVVNGLHCEHLELSGNPGWGLVGVGTGSGMVQVNGLSVRFCTFTGTSYNSVARITGGSGQTVAVRGLNFPAGDGGDSTPALLLIDFNSATNVTAQVYGINGAAAQLYTAASVNAGAGCTAQLGSQVVPYTTGFTAFATGGAPNLLNVSSGTQLTPVAGTFYYASLWVPYNCTLTGIIAAAGTVSGSDSWIVALWTAAGGAAIANSALAGTAAPANSSKKQFAFTAAAAVQGPGAYIIGVQSNGTTNRIFVFPNNLEGFITGSAAGSFGTVPSLSPAGSYSQNIGPMASTY
jgi:hypothetical protein